MNVYSEQLFHLIPLEESVKGMHINMGIEELDWYLYGYEQNKRKLRSLKTANVSDISQDINNYEYINYVKFYFVDREDFSLRPLVESPSIINLFKTYIQENE